MGGGVHDAEESTAVPTGVPATDDGPRAALDHLTVPLLTRPRRPRTISCAATDAPTSTAPTARTFPKGDAPAAWDGAADLGNVGIGPEKLTAAQ